MKNFSYVDFTYFKYSIYLLYYIVLLTFLGLVVACHSLINIVRCRCISLKSLQASS